MSKFVYVLIGAAAVFLAFRYNVWLGVAALVIILAIAVYVLYPNIVIGRANAEFNNGNYDSAIKKYQKVLKSSRARTKTLIDYSRILMRVGRYDEAMESINRVLARKRDKQTECLAKTTRAMINYHIGNYEESKAEVDELFEDGYKTSATYGLMGYLMLVLNCPIEEILAVCKEAYEYDSDCRDIEDNLVCCYLRMGKLEEAKEVSDKLVDEAPEFVEAFYHAALVYEALGDLDKAKEYANHLKDCKRTKMTTISEADEKELVERLAK